MAEAKQFVVNQGATYEANEGGERVVAFYVNRPRSEVSYAPLGSGREERTSIDEFLKNYKLIAQEGEALPEDRNQKASNTRTEDTNLSIQNTPNTNRAELDERAAKRNK
jgi:hypothetical protein